MTALVVAIVSAAVVACFGLHLESVRLTSRVTQRTLDEADKACAELRRVLAKEATRDAERAAHEAQLEARLDEIEKRELRRGMR